LHEGPEGHNDDNEDGRELTKQEEATLMTILGKEKRQNLGESDAKKNPGKLVEALHKTCREFLEHGREGPSVSTISSKDKELVDLKKRVQLAEDKVSKLTTSLESEKATSEALRKGDKKEAKNEEKKEEAKKEEATKAEEKVSKTKPKSVSKTGKRMPGNKVGKCGQVYYEGSIRPICDMSKEYEECRGDRNIKIFSPGNKINCVDPDNLPGHGLLPRNMMDSYGGGPLWVSLLNEVSKVVYGVSKWMCPRDFLASTDKKGNSCCNSGDEPAVLCPQSGKFKFKPGDMMKSKKDKDKIRGMCGQQIRGGGRRRRKGRERKELLLGEEFLRRRKRGGKLRGMLNKARDAKDEAGNKALVAMISKISPEFAHAVGGIMKCVNTEIKNGKDGKKNPDKEARGPFGALKQGLANKNDFVPVCNDAMLELRYAFIGKEVCNYECWCKNILSPVVLNPVRMNIAVRSMCFRRSDCITGRKDASIVGNADCDQAERVLAEAEEKVSDIKAKGKEYRDAVATHKKGKLTEYGNAIATYKRDCPARDFDVFKGGATVRSPRGVDKKECIRRCRLSGFRFAGRQGGSQQAGAHQCFCTHTYGHLGVIHGAHRHSPFISPWYSRQIDGASCFTDGKGEIRNAVFSSKKDPREIKAIRECKSAEEAAKFRPDPLKEEQQVTMSYIKRKGNGPYVIDWDTRDKLVEWSSKPESDGGPGWGGPNTKNIFPDMGGSLYCDHKDMTQKPLAIPLPTLKNCVFEVTDDDVGFFVGTSVDQELDRVLVENRDVSQYSLYDKVKNAQGYGSDGADLEPVTTSGKPELNICRLAIDTHMSTCRGCCCDKGDVLKRVNTNLLIGNEEKNHGGPQTIYGTADVKNTTLQDGKRKK